MISVFKVCLIAGKEVGKKTFLEKYSDFYSYNPYVRDITAIGVAFPSVKVKIDEGYIRLSVWVISDEEKFKFTYGNFLKGANGMILLYDITNQESLSIFPSWIQMVHDYSNKRKTQIPILLVGNKLDLEAEREVSQEQVENFKENHNISSLMEISLKTGENVEKMVMNITRMIQKRFLPDLLPKLEQEFSIPSPTRTKIKEIDEIQEIKISSEQKNTKKMCDSCKHFIKTVGGLFVDHIGLCNNKDGKKNTDLLSCEEWEERYK